MKWTEYVHIEDIMERWKFMTFVSPFHSQNEI